MNILDDLPRLPTIEDLLLEEEQIEQEEPEEEEEEDRNPQTFADLPEGTLTTEDYYEGQRVGLVPIEEILAVRLMPYIERAVESSPYMESMAQGLRAIGAYINETAAPAQKKLEDRIGVLEQALLRGMIK